MPKFVVIDLGSFHFGNLSTETQLGGRRRATKVTKHCMAWDGAGARIADKPVWQTSPIERITSHAF